METELYRAKRADNHVSNVAISSFQLVSTSHVKKEKKRNAKKSD